MPFRPKTLKEVAQQASTIEAWGSALAEFLDEVNRARKQNDRQSLWTAISDEPPILRSQFQSGDAADAFSAALAEYLAETLSLSRPTWTQNADRYLDHAWYPLANISEHPRLRVLIEAKTPQPFRDRNVFIDENSLART